MGCFLGCFGSSKDRKQRKQRYKAIDTNQNPKSESLVQNDASLVQSIKDKPCDSLPELRGNKIEEPLNLSTRKKVTFDANVTTYDHIQVFDSTESLLQRNEKDETFPKSTQFNPQPNVINVVSNPPNYRYGNCLESDEEIEDLESEDETDDTLDNEEDYDNKEKSNDESRNESFVNPVLKPVENLAQWKALKSRSPLDSNPIPQKENTFLNTTLNTIPFPLKNRNQETAVDASLSNWLVSSEKNTPNNKQVSTTNTVKSVEDIPVLGALSEDELKQISGSTCTPRKSTGRSPDDVAIIGSVGSYWSETGSAQSLKSVSSYKGIPNTTSKYREDKKVNWHNTPFETRLERALNRNAN